MTEFKDCVECIGVEDINQFGLFYTWNQLPNSDYGILKKLDRVMSNGAFLNDFINAHAIFKPNRLSDHCPVILSIPLASNGKPKPFKFANFVVSKPEFIPLVKASWPEKIEGFYLYQVVKKLKRLKAGMQKLM